MFGKITMQFRMKAPPPPPLLAETNGRPQARKQPLLGRFSKVGILIIGLLLLAYVWPQLQEPQSRRALWGKTIALFFSADSYIFAVVLLINSLLYSLIIYVFYPTGTKTAKGLARVIMFFKRDTDSFVPDSDKHELKHVFLILVLPVLVFAAGTAEYQLLQQWLHR